MDHRHSQAYRQCVISSSLTSLARHSSDAHMQDEFRVTTRMGLDVRPNIYAHVSEIELGQFGYKIGCHTLEPMTDTDKYIFAEDQRYRAEETARFAAAKARVEARLVAQANQPSPPAHTPRAWATGAVAVLEPIGQWLEAWISHRVACQPAPLHACWS